MKKFLSHFSLWSIGLIIFGNILMAFVVNNFLLPYHLGEGGASGLTIILFYLFGIPLYLSNIVINGILLVLGWKFLDPRTMYYTIFSTILYSICLKWIPNFAIPIKEPLLVPLIVGVLTGIAIGTVVLAGGTTAGSDILARMLNKYFGWNTGTAVLIIDFIIILPFFLITGFERTILSILNVVLNGKTIDFVLYGLNPRKSVMIISDHADRIAEELQATIDRGITVLHGHGYYTKDKKDILYIIVTRQQLMTVNNVVNFIDPQAFFIVTSVQNVNGQGFSYFINEKVNETSNKTLDETKKEVHSLY
ncbi:YitT family protein [Atopobacter sp. AH10]|uniref:YitT family protein n=1 Tax=Atopobacter sp. AH10 TaxID=2315861 RepID=UPI000EF26D2D|nr:YitT family protein [Atopobacter sp. AH10]RLK63730.1 YitT family protein [Atopobacter sp. AH10]